MKKKMTEKREAGRRVMAKTLPEKWGGREVVCVVDREAPVQGMSLEPLSTEERAKFPSRKRGSHLKGEDLCDGRIITF